MVMKFPESMRPCVFQVLNTLSIWLGDKEQYLWSNPSMPNDVEVFDSTTGARKWKWTGIVWTRVQVAGDTESYARWYQVGNKFACCAPNTWSGPVIGVEGTLYVGNQNGRFYTIRDNNGDGQIDDAT